MANVFPIGSEFTVNAGNNGNTLVLGDADYNDMGGFHLHFDGTTGAFAGSLTVLSRSRVGSAQTDNAPWNYAPHRPGYLNGAVLAAGSIYVFTYGPITTTTQTIIPASGQFIALSVACSSGSGRLYVQPIVGESAIG